MNLTQDLTNEQRRFLTRRWFFRECGVGLGSIALGSLLQDRLSSSAQAALGTNPMGAKAPHFPAKAKRVIYLFQAGAPSHLELFDHKPELAKWDGKLPPAELLKGYRAAFINPNSTLLGPKYKFNKVGRNGTELSELLPGLAEVVDDVAIVKSMQTDAFNHAPAQIFMNTGAQQFGRPSMGSWVTYGLGSESQDLPGYVVFSTGQKGTSGGSSNWGSGFLPTAYQGVPFRGQGEPVLYLSNPAGVDRELQRVALEFTINAGRIGKEEDGFALPSERDTLISSRQEPGAPIACTAARAFLPGGKNHVPWKILALAAESVRDP